MINITVIGFGYVGTVLSMLLLNNQHNLRLNVMEPDKQKEGIFLDIAHGMTLNPNKEFIVNNEDLFIDADFIFYTAGIPNVHGVSRLSIAKQNIQLTRKLFEGRQFSKIPYIIAITNPVDIVAHALYRFSGVPHDYIVGTGTFLDSVRLSYYLSAVTDYRANDFDAYVLGEHGESQFAAYSISKVKDTPILNCKDFDVELLITAEKMTRNAAYQIRETQKGTAYGVAKCAEIIMNSLLDEKTNCFALSVLTNGFFNSLLELDHPIYISVPVEISDQGIRIVDDLRFTEAECLSYRKSAAILAAIEVE